MKRESNKPDPQKSNRNIGSGLATGIAIGLLLDSANARKTKQKDKIPPKDKPS